jgi:hypothetical protein
LCNLAEEAGFIFRNQTGSHRIYKHPQIPELLGLQKLKGGAAKPYQVKQLLRLIAEHDLVD